MLSHITPVVITLNEEANIGRTLGQLGWADCVLVMDSYSEDRTCDLVQDCPNAVLVQRRFDDFARQCTAAIRHPAITTEWVMPLDADYFLTGELIDEISALRPAANTAAYSARFDYCLDGEVINANLYPPRIILARKKELSFYMDGHAHRRKVNGATVRLIHPVRHDDRKPQELWQHNQLLYARREAAKLLTNGNQTLRVSDLVRKYIPYSPYLVGIYCGLFKRLWFGGPNGRKYVKQRMFFEHALQTELAKPDTGTNSYEDSSDD